MESLVNYESDDESGDCNDLGKCNSQAQEKVEEDANYDEIGMDESSECHDPNLLDLRQSEGHSVQESSAQNRNKTTKPLNCDEASVNSLPTVLCDTSYVKPFSLNFEKETQKEHIRHLMLWEFKQGNSAKATAEKICRFYGEGLITDRAVRNWFIKFRSGDTTLRDEPRAGRPSDFDDELLKEILEQNPHLSTRDIAERLNTSQSTVNRHLKKLGKISKSGVWVTQNVTQRNNEERMSVATSLLSRESNNNHAEGHFSDVRDKQGGFKAVNVKHSRENESDQETFRDFTSKSEGESSQNGVKGEGNWSTGEFSKMKNDGVSTKGEEFYRRHSSDMEMDDGEDDLDNYKSGDSKCAELSLDFRHKFPLKSINFTKGKSYVESSRSPTSGSNFCVKNATSSWDARSTESEKNINSEESQTLREEKIKREKGKDSEDRKKEDYFRKDDKDNRKRDEDRSRESARDRKKESEKYNDDRDRKRSPDRRDYKKRSHSPDRRERDRDCERDRDRDRSRDRERDRDRDRERERDRDRTRDRDRDRDRDREYRSGDRRSPKYSRRSSGSPERSWKARKLEKKAAVLNKLGIELKADVTGNLTPRQLLGEQLKAQIQEVEAKTGVTLPTYYNPGVMNPLKYAQQIQKRKLLWGNKSNDSKSNESATQGSSVPSTVKQWEAATFKGDNDGKMTEKFKRLMGIKGDASAGNVTSASTKPSETKEIIQKQEEMFSNMEAQYQVARMATHTHRGVGLGFGTFQVPPR